MFGNLFDSQPESSAFSVDSRVVSDFLPNLQAPVVPRPPCGLCGLQNQGATCYLNTLIQTLLYTPEFRDTLLRIPLSELQGSPVTESAQERGQQVDTNGQVKERVIPLELQRLFSRLLLLNARAVSTSDLTRSFGWKEQGELYQQQDVQELNRILFVALERSLVGTSGQDLVSSLHRGTLLNQVQCLQCKNVSQSLEDFLDLTLIVSKDIRSLEQSLATTFLEHENMKGNNQYFCNQCGIPVDAQKSSKVKFLPPILTFSLLRFNYDFLKGCRYKETGDFSFPLELDMGAFCCQSQGSMGTRYELFSVIIHSGSTFGGHYHAYIKDIECLGTWEPYDLTDSGNEVKLEVSSKKEDGDQISDMLKDPASVLATVLSLQPQKGMTIDSLCMELKNHIGSSWNKQYKKTHGPILKYLQKHETIFVVSGDAKQVSLAKEFAAQDHSVKSQQASPISDVSVSANEAHWFDFNDSEVRPIREKQLFKLFSGQESAYMLCYRNTSLMRPLEARRNNLYAVPDHLLSMISDENAQLLQERQEYEKRLNTLQLHIIFGIFYRQERGTLQESEDSQSFQISVDQTSTLQQLRDLIFAQYKEFCGDGVFSIYRAASIHVGLHLVEFFPPDKINCTLADLKIANQEQLLVSFGNQVLGVPVGPENVPLLLTFTCNLPSGDDQEINWAFPKSVTFAEVKAHLASHMPTLKLPLHIFPSHPKYESSWKTGVADTASLEGLGVTDGDHLLVFEASPDLCCIRIDNKIHECLNKTLGTAQSSKLFSAPRSTSVLAFKMKAMAALGIPANSSQKLVLRKPQKASKNLTQCSLLENQSLEDLFSGLQFCPLVLEEGQPVSDQVPEEFLDPEKSPVRLTFTCHLSNGSDHNISLAVLKKSSVAEIKSQLASVLPALKPPLLIFRSKLKEIPSWNDVLPDEKCLDNSLPWDAVDHIFHVWEGTADTCCVQVYDRTFDPAFHMEDSMVQSKLFSSDKNMDLLSFKVDVMLAFGIELDCSQRFRFRKVELSKVFREPPLHESQRLGDVFPKSFFCPLVLEEGRPPAPNEITLFWSIGVSRTTHMNVNFTLDCSAQGCLDHILAISGVSDLNKNWHLCKGDWLGEPTHQSSLHSEIQSLEGLQHGDLIYLLEGPPPPPTFLTLQVHLFPTPDCLSSTPAPCSTTTSRWTRSREIESLLKEQWDQSQEPYLSLGQVELSSSCTLLELKKQILTLHPLNNLCVPSANLLRLRLFQNKSMGKVLRGNASPLSKLKLCNHQILCAELLDQEEDLLTTDILLNVCCLSPSKHHYATPVNVVWNAGRKATSKSLLSCFATLFNLNSRRLSVTKYCLESDSWRLLAIGENCNTGVPEKIMFRKGKMNLRNTPYSVNEGDLIVIKECSMDGVDGFHNEMELDGLKPSRRKEQKRIVEAKEPVRQKAAVEPIVTLRDHVPPRREVGISIHVDDFS